MKCKELASDDTLPLNEKIIDASMRTIGMAIPPSLYAMWVKKCHMYLECTYIENQKKQFQKKGNIGEIYISKP